MSESGGMTSMSEIEHVIYTVGWQQRTKVEVKEQRRGKITQSRSDLSFLKLVLALVLASACLSFIMQNKEHIYRPRGQCNHSHFSSYKLGKMVQRSTLLFLPSSDRHSSVTLHSFIAGRPGATCIPLLTFQCGLLAILYSPRTTTPTKLEDPVVSPNLSQSEVDHEKHPQDSDPVKFVL